MATLDKIVGSHSRPNSYQSRASWAEIRYFGSQTPTPLTSGYYRNPRLGFWTCACPLDATCIYDCFPKLPSLAQLQKLHLLAQLHPDHTLHTFYLIRSNRLAGYCRLYRSRIIDRTLLFTVLFDIQAHSSARRYHIGRAWSAR